jgi:phenylacetate-coenzyme A ligase PaaK-like adenylate-forming protein
MSSLSVATPVTPLDAWIATRVCALAGELSREQLEQYQLAQLRQTIHTVKEHSLFYARQLREVDGNAIRSLRDFARLPFTTAADLEEHGHEFVCVSQSEVARVVTMESSGTSGARKRLFFSTRDQESALEFFHHGVATLARPGDRMLIALPGERHGSVGKLLAAGIERAGITPLPWGLIDDPAAVLAVMDREQVSCIIGFPVQLLELASQRGALADRAFRRLRSIVLCSDHVSTPLVETLRRRARCEVFEHYGMTEMCLGGGVDCLAHHGYHLREADLLFEIVDPATGRLLPDGETGEVVFSTLTRDAMPLIRYRTGDLSSFAAAPCPCGSVLRNLRRIEGRVGAAVRPGNGGHLSMAQLDDALFAVPGVVDFRARVAHAPSAQLLLLCRLEQVGVETTLVTAQRAVERIPAIAAALRDGTMRVVIAAAPERFPFNGAKRVIEEQPTL